MIQPIAGLTPLEVHSLAIYCGGLTVFFYLFWETLLRLLTGLTHSDCCIYYGYMNPVRSPGVEKRKTFFCRAIMGHS